MRTRLLLLVVLGLSNAASADDPPRADVVLRGGRVFDGRTLHAEQQDVALRDGKIIAVGQFAGAADWTVDCNGLIVSAGFIDLHNHSDRQVVDADTRGVVNYLMQGCTTIVTGNCGSGPVNVGQYYEKIDAAGAGTNVVHLLPQGSLRGQVVGSALRKATPDEIAQMQSLTKQAMRDGAWGMSTGLIYVPSSYADTEELIALAKIVGENDGIYASHIRGEGVTLLASVEEALKIGEEANLPVHISHFKASGRDAWGLVRQAVNRIEQAREAGQRATADQYPYVASSTSLDATLLPTWALDGGRKKLLERLKDPQQGQRLRTAILDKLRRCNDGEALRISRYTPRPDWAGQSLAAIAKDEGTEPLQIALQVIQNGGAGIVNFSMSEDDVRFVMQQPWVATASDGRAYVPSAEVPHPRNYGTFPRKLGYYARDEKVLPLEQALRSMTSLPAEILGLTDRGELKVGQAADVVVFDPESVLDRATFDQPHQYATGMRYVFVNGRPAVVAGQATGALAGRALRHPRD